ncbi:MAG: 16S rRNA processing protein RimM [Clostridia bacterium]|nr:16S rRNA processing protein RimM [Clostridia bacterium]
MKEFLEIGRVVGTHGVRGEMRVECWCDSPEQFKKLKRLYVDGGRTELKVLGARVHKSMVLLTVDGVTDIPAAETYRGRTLYHRRGDIKLPKGAHFIEDLLGLEVRDADTDELYGRIGEVFNTGANDIYRLIREGEPDVLVPVIPPIVKEVSPEKGVIRITPMAGLFEDEDV